MNHHTTTIETYDKSAKELAEYFRGVGPTDRTYRACSRISWCFRPAVFDKVREALKPGGIFYISVKERDEYTKEPRIDQYGERMFFYYTPELMNELAGEGFEAVFADRLQDGNTKWLYAAFQKRHDPGAS